MSRDHATALQPRQQDRNSISKKKSQNEMTKYLENNYNEKPTTNRKQLKQGSEEITFKHMERNIKHPILEDRNTNNEIELCVES